jgi:phage shock protein PspC (stress-responsive transcriptional regulator)
MKEITRIHIAKIPYEIEVAAKKELETYIQSLEAYSIDEEIIEDIEVRITEIFLERGIKKSGVVSQADVKAVKRQLGEPEDFMGDGDIAIGSNDDRMNHITSRKLYRNTDNAVVGGVLSGIAAFFNINPLWARLAFVILALASFGTMILVYVVLWIVVPPAKTAADKLQMAGRAVTVSSIREMNENEVNKSDNMNNANTKRITTMLLGVGCVIGATIAAIITIVAAFAMMLSGRFQLFDVVVNSKSLLAAYILAIISGLLLVVMFILAAYALFVQKIGHRVLVSLCVVIVLGLISFGTAVGLVQYGSLQISQAIQANTRTIPVQLPINTNSATGLIIDAKQMKVQYIVSKNAPTATLRAIAKDQSSMPKVTLTLENGVLKVSSHKILDNNCTIEWGCGDKPTVVIYGPALTQLTADEESLVEYQAGDQQNLMVTAQQDANVSISSGAVTDFKVIAKDDATVSMADATIQHLSAEVKTSSSVEAGTVQAFTLIDQESSCPLHTRETRISVWRVASGTMTVNGVVRPVKTTDSGCVEITIESEEK